jgi:hypothetical protein
MKQAPKAWCSRIDAYSVIHQVALGWISSEPPKIEHFHVQNSEFRSSAGHKDQPFSFTFP